MAFCQSYFKCFVTTVPGALLSMGEPTLLRSYHSSVPQTPPLNYHWLVSDAALATSAAPSYFEPFSLPPNYTFKDAGAFGFNNPTEVAINEIKRIEAFKDRDIGCIVSLGTGKARQSQFEQLTDLNGSGSTPSFIKSLARPPMRYFNELKEILINTATNTERVHASVYGKLAFRCCLNVLFHSLSDCLDTGISIFDSTRPPTLEKLALLSLRGVVIWR
jgi:patatin-like phospholipase/acyl hydrolase